MQTVLNSDIWFDFSCPQLTTAKRRPNYNGEHLLPFCHLQNLNNQKILLDQTENQMSLFWINKLVYSYDEFLVLLAVAVLRAKTRTRGLCAEEPGETCKFLNSSSPWNVGVSLLFTRFPQENTKLAFPSAAVMFSLA